MVSKVAVFDAGVATRASTKARHLGSSAQATRARIYPMARAASCATATHRKLNHCRMRSERLELFCAVLQALMQQFRMTRHNWPGGTLLLLAFCTECHNAMPES